MQRIRVSTNVVLEITDEIETISLSESPYLYVYEYGSDYLNNKQVIFEDGETEERTKSYWVSANNTILSATPNFYPDVKIGSGFHGDSRIDNLLSSISPTNPMQYRKVRMLFAQGFSYNVESGGTAITTLNINAVRPSNNARIDLLSYYDSYDNSSIEAIPQVLYDNQLFNSAITMRIMDLAFLFDSDSEDIIAVKELLFGDDEIETLFVEHAGVEYDNITTFSDSFDFTRFSDSNKSRSQFSPRFNNDEIVCNVSKLSNGTVTAQMVHERFSLEGFLKRTSEVSDVTYTMMFSEYDSSANLIGSKIVKVSTPTNLFDLANYRHTPLDDTDHINVTVEGYIEQYDNTKIYRSGSIVLTDPTILKTQVLSAILEEETLVRADVKEIKNVIYKPDTPSIIKIEKPVYVQINDTADEIILTPNKQAVKINVSADVSLVRTIKLSIGNNSYFNESDDKFTFRIGSEAYYTSEKTYYLLDEQDSVISYGDIKRVST